MPQFSGHWYSGRAARLVFVEAALVGMALWISGHQARGWRELAALVAAAACVPAALYLADLYDPQVMRNDERGHNRVLVIGAGQRALEIERVVRTEAYGEYEVAGKLDPTVDLGEQHHVSAVGGGEVVAAAGALLEQDGPAANEVALAPTPEVVPSSHLIVGP